MPHQPYLTVLPPLAPTCMLLSHLAPKAYVVHRFTQPITYKSTYCTPYGSVGGTYISPPMVLIIGAAHRWLYPQSQPGSLSPRMFSKKGHPRGSIRQSPVLHVAGRAYALWTPAGFDIFLLGALLAYNQSIYSIRTSRLVFTAEHSANTSSHSSHFLSRISLLLS